MSGGVNKTNIYILGHFAPSARASPSTSCPPAKTTSDTTEDDDGKIVVEEDKLMEVWRVHYDEISNEEFAWDRNSLTN